MPYRNGNKVWNAIEWTEKMIRYLQDNFHKRTNQELADHLGLKLTIVRMKSAELGLKKFKPEYWNRDMKQFLKDHYQTMGDVEIMEVFETRWPKNKGWKRGAIRKKRRQMNLERTPRQIEMILKRHHAKGGRMYTIEKNSSSKNLHDSWVVQHIAWRDPVLQKQILMHRPDLIEVKRQLILLKRMIKLKRDEA